MKYFLSSSPSFSDSRRNIVSYKRKRVHKALPSLSMPQKSVARLIDHLNMAMTIDLGLKPKQKYHKIAPGVSHIYKV